MTSSCRYGIAVLLTTAVIPGYCILCYVSNCVTDDAAGCPPSTSNSYLHECHISQFVDNIKNKSTEMTSLHNVTDADMRCLRLSAILSYGNKKSQIEYRACVPPDPRRCDILRQDTEQAYRSLKNTNAAFLQWDCEICATHRCNSGSLAFSKHPVFIASLIFIAFCFS